MTDTHECNECGKNFASRYSMERHRKELHFDDNLSSQTDNESDESDSGESNDASQMSEDENNMTQSSSEDSNTDEESDGEDGDSVFNDIICQTLYTHREKRDQLISELVDSGKSENEANIYANSKLLWKYRKTMRQLFTELIFKIERVKNHSITKAIEKKVEELEDDGMDHDEAIRAAIGYRKHLIDRLFPVLKTTSCNMSSSDDDDEMN